MRRRTPKSKHTRRRASTGHHGRSISLELTGYRCGKGADGAIREITANAQISFQSRIGRTVILTFGSFDAPINNERQKFSKLVSKRSSHERGQTSHGKPLSRPPKDFRHWSTWLYTATPSTIFPSAYIAVWGPLSPSLFPDPIAGPRDDAPALVMVRMGSKSSSIQTCRITVSGPARGLSVGQSGRRRPVPLQGCHTSVLMSLIFR